MVEQLAQHGCQRRESALGVHCCRGKGGTKPYTCDVHPPTPAPTHPPHAPADDLGLPSPHTPLLPCYTPRYTGEALDEMLDELLADELEDEEDEDEEEEEGGGGGSARKARRRPGGCMGLL